MDASGASSSSTAVDSINSSSVDYRCGVFINHRGPDTKKTFASYLYRSLLNHGLRPFLDQEELEVGSKFPTQIDGAIRSASVHVAIFSTSYANSPWCLHELVLMLESKAPIIPIFYDVDPSALRWIKGEYAEALNQLQMKKTVDPQTDEEKPRYDSATLQNWRNALSSVADISGFDLMGKFNGRQERKCKWASKCFRNIARHDIGGQVIWPHYSCHYRATEENLFEFLTCMGKNGFDIADVEKMNSILMVRSKN